MMMSIEKDTIIQTIKEYENNNIINNWCLIIHIWIYNRSNSWILYIRIPPKNENKKYKSRIAIMEAFVKLVERMRFAQTKYNETRQFSDKNICQELEKQVDQAIKKYHAEKHGKQEQLFK